MFLDPLEELYRKPDPTMADGQNLTSMYGRFPQELLGCQIEDIDFYYRSKKVGTNQPPAGYATEKVPHLEV